MVGLIHPPVPTALQVHGSARAALPNRDVQRSRRSNAAFSVFPDPLSQATHSASRVLVCRASNFDASPVATVRGRRASSDRVDINSVYSNVVFEKRRRSSVATVSSVDALESNMGHFGTIKKRYGHPSYYKMDGYDLGLRYKVKGVMQSFFVGCSRKTGEKVTIKEFHRSFSPTDDTSIMTEVLLLTKMSHA
eukprot:gene10401-13351_t